MRERILRHKWQWDKRWEQALWARARRDRARWFSPWVLGGAAATASELSKTFHMAFTRKMILGKFDRMRRNWNKEGRPALPSEIDEAQGVGGDAPTVAEKQPMEERN